MLDRQFTFLHPPPPPLLPPLPKSTHVDTNRDDDEDGTDTGAVQFALSTAQAQIARSQAISLSLSHYSLALTIPYLSGMQVSARYFSFTTSTPTSGQGRLPWLVVSTSKRRRLSLSRARLQHSISPMHVHSTVYTFHMPLLHLPCLPALPSAT